MYRGSGGAEVAYLLRRLHSRLGVSRERVRYILTSASFGSSAESERRIKLFAADLTGLERSGRSFSLIRGEPLKKMGERVATSKEADALSEYDFASLHKIYETAAPAEAALRHLFTVLGVKVPNGPLDLEALQSLAHQWLVSFGPAALATNLITSHPQPLKSIAGVVFPSGRQSGRSLESLLALMSFGREVGTDRVFAPARLHLFFRGLPGLFACVNPRCAGRLSIAEPSVLGRLSATPQLRCECGSRVYELLTHRDCGAAFIRGYLRDENGDFLWHEPSAGLWSGGGLREAHFLVEVGRQSRRDSAEIEGSKTWLHRETGRLMSREPGPDLRDEYLPLIRPAGLVDGPSGRILSFDGECPVCVRRWQGDSKIMDLVTKGEAPFAHLVRQQVRLQPATRPATEQSPNGGRKSLLFSDGPPKGRTTCAGHSSRDRAGRVSPGPDPCRCRTQ